MDQRTRKLMTMNKTLNPRDDVDWLYVSRKGVRGLTSIEYSVDALVQRLEDYIEGHEERLITATRNNTDNTRINRTKILRKQKWKKQLYGYFKRQTSNISYEKTCTWLRKRNLKKETKSHQIAAKHNAIRTNHIKARIDKTQQNSKCRLYGDWDEMNNHISECSKLAPKEYKTRHDWVSKGIHRE